MTRIITDDELVKAFDAAVEERGRDFVYPDEWKVSWGINAPSNACLYNLDDGSPACIIGLAFHRLGLPPATGVITDALDMTSTLTREDYENDVDAEGPLEGDPLLWRERADVRFEMSFAVRQAAQYAQGAQDAGKTWGEASETFHRSLDGEAPGSD